MTLNYMKEIYENPGLLTRLYETKEESGIIIEVWRSVLSSIVSCWTESEVVQNCLINTIFIN